MMIVYALRPLTLGLDALTIPTELGELVPVDNGWKVWMGAPPAPGQPDTRPTLSVQVNGDYQTRGHDVAGNFEVTQRHALLNVLLYTPSGMPYAIAYRPI